MGTDLHPNLKTYGSRTAITRALRKGGNQFVNPGLFLTLAVKGHRLDPKQCDCYHPIAVARRMLTGPGCNQIVTEFCQTWESYRVATPEQQSKLKGPCRRLHQVAEQLELQWSSPLVFGRKNKAPLHLNKQDTQWWLHETRAQKS